MKPLTRRSLLVGVGVTATAGCQALPVVGGSGQSSLRGETVKSLSESVTLSKDEFQSYKLELDTQSVVMYSVVADKKIDCIMFTRPHFKKYRQNSTAELPMVGELSALDTRAVARGSDVSSGKPVLVIDNTTWGEASPVADVTVNVELDVFIRPEHT